MSDLAFMILARPRNDGLEFWRHNMADGYEVFDTGHNKLVFRHQLLNPKQIEQVMVGLRSLHLSGVEEARMLLLKAAGRRITLVTELYDVELHKVLAYIGREKRRCLPSGG
jgi:hypothetical protein